MSNLNITISRLESEWKALALRWEETRKVWTDLVRRDFEREYWESLMPHPPAVQREMERLAQVIAGARRSVK
jgi:predicted membrane chloride channel (bestrophin family)